MKILVTAYACTPQRGSEHFVGWSWIRTIAKNHDVWLLCGDKEVAHIEKARAAGGVPERIRAVISPGKPIVPWHGNRFISRLQAWTWPLAFERDVARIAPQLHREIGFDLCHAITIASWRMPSGLRNLGIPFVRGPMGGGEAFPFRFFGILSQTGKLYETLRYTSDIQAAFRPSIRKSLQSPNAVIVTNRQTAAKLKHLGRKKPIILCPNLLRRSTLEEIRRICDSLPKADKLTIFCGGSAEGRKGVAIALLVLAEVKRRGISFQFTYGGDGPEFPYLESLRVSLGFGSEVTLDRSLGGEAYLEKIAQSHLFLFPSLRDNGPITLLEAMSAGCVPFVVDNGGPGEAVTPECGYSFAPSTAGELVQKMAATIAHLAVNPRELAEKSGAAVHRVEHHFLEERADAALKEAYATAISLHQIRN